MSTIIRRGSPVQALGCFGVRNGLCPLTTDTLPVLGPVPGVRDVVLATGNRSRGLTMGPYSGRVVVDLILGEAPTTDITAFGTTRFLARTMPGRSSSLKASSASQTDVLTAEQDGVTIDAHHRIHI